MGDTLSAIRKRGYLRSGVSLGLTGLSEYRDGYWSGFDIDVAKAVATLILDDASPIEFVPLASERRFEALKSKDIDIGTFNSSINIGRIAKYGVHFVHPILFDGELIMQRKGESASTVTVAALQGSTTEENLNRYFTENRINAIIKNHKTFDEARDAYETGMCNAYCLDGYLLAGERLKLSVPSEHIIKPERISLEAMSPAVRAEDISLWRIASLATSILIEAENLSIDQENLHEHVSSPRLYVHSFLNPSADFCKGLNISKGAVKSLLTAVGNYADVFERNLGAKSALQQPRRENQLRKNGGILFSPLFI